MGRYVEKSLLWLMIWSADRIEFRDVALKEQFEESFPRADNGTPADPFSVIFPRAGSLAITAEVATAALAFGVLAAPASPAPVSGLKDVG
jgi:hypothetical protein